MTDVVFCPGPALARSWCGRYATLDVAQRARGPKPWHEMPPIDPYAYGAKARYVCDDCFRAHVKARVRAALANGALHNGIKLSDLSPQERQAAAEVLGPEWMATVDKGWEESRRETPPYGISMGRAN